MGVVIVPFQGVWQGCAKWRSSSRDALGRKSSSGWEIPDDGAHPLEQLSPLVAEVVYFAARESIRNAARHGRADDMLPTLKIAINQRAQEWEIVIEDD